MIFLVHIRFKGACPKLFFRFNWSDRSGSDNLGNTNFGPSIFDRWLIGEVNDFRTVVSADIHAIFGLIIVWWGWVIIIIYLVLTGRSTQSTPLNPTARTFMNEVFREWTATATRCIPSELITFGCPFGNGVASTSTTMTNTRPDNRPLIKIIRIRVRLRWLVTVVCWG